MDSASVHSEHAIQDERVEVDVEIEGAAEALNDRHGAAAAIGDAVSPSAMPEEPEHHSQRDADDGATQLVIPSDQVPQPMRQTQDPLSNRHIRKHMIDQMRRPLGHPATAAPRAEAAALARKGHEAILPAGGAPKAREAAGQTAAP